ISKYVSLSSMLTGIYTFIYSIFTQDLFLIIVVAVLAGFVIFRHIANLKRILNKTEPKIKWL
ncbi:glycerol-3-phosphate acyltransferase, partial [Bacillus altitudinis]